jgi:hypothetical protein
MNSFQGKAAKSALIGGLYCNKAMLWDSVVSLLATMIGLLGDKRKQAPTRFGPGGGTEGGTNVANLGRHSVAAAAGFRASVLPLS